MGAVMRSSARGALVVAVALLAGAVHGQSLADLARAEAERREQARRQRTEARTYTDGDLPGGASSRAAEASPDTAPARPPARDRLEADRAARTQQEAYWRKRAADARARVAKAERDCSTHPLTLGGG
jgi:hypothetical protein